MATPDRTDPPPARSFRCLVITLSDRAAAGVYADGSGPRVRELLEQFFAQRTGEVIIEQILLPDDAGRLRDAVMYGLHQQFDAIFTTGGTGLGPRDIAPETVAPLCDRLISGIMEHIRAKFGATNPRARLSRAVAGVAGKTQIYTLPGSVRAVEEYMPEILATLEHVTDVLGETENH